MEGDALLRWARIVDGERTGGHHALPPRDFFLEDAILSGGGDGDPEALFELVEAREGSFVA